MDSAGCSHYSQVWMPIISAEDVPFQIVFKVVESVEYPVVVSVSENSVIPGF